MEARTAGLYFPFVMVGFTDSKLVISALQIFVEAFVRDDSFLCHVISLVMRLSRAAERKDFCIRRYAGSEAVDGRRLIT